MPKLEFSDGMTFDIDGPYRVEHRKDGFYLVGNGVLCPVDSALEGYRLAEQFSRPAPTQDCSDE